jgi:hypothetical protein
MGAMRGRGFLRRWDLLLPAVLAPAAEVAALHAIGLSSAASLAPQITAPPPFDLFHDLRWIAVYHSSWWLLALELVVALILRSLWVAYVVQRSWPDEPVPPMGQAVRRVTVYHAVAAVLLTPWVVLLFGLAVTHLSFLFFAALPPVLVIAVAIHGGALRAAGRRHWAPTGRGLVWILGAFLWLTASGALISEAPAPVGILIASLTGVVNARAWYGIVRAIARPQEEIRLRVRALPAVVVALTLIVAVGGTALGFQLGGAGRPDVVLTLPSDEARPGDRPVLVAPGLFGHPDMDRRVELPGGFAVSYFSYRGADDQGRGLPYGYEDTLQPVILSAERMAEQIASLNERFGHPVTIVAESAGAIVARTYLVHLYDPSHESVDRLIALDMPYGASTVYFPNRGEQGWGVGTGWGLRGLALLINRFAPFRVSADAPIIRGSTDCRSFFDHVMNAPLPEGVKEVSIEALADWVDRPERHTGGAPVVVVNRPHGGLIYEEETRFLLAGILNSGEDPGEKTNRLARLISAVSSPWLLPRLDPRLATGGNCSIL